ncbi:MAG: ATP-binding protein [Candidatus Thermoplasmatota archaeon]
MTTKKAVDPDKEGVGLRPGVKSIALYRHLSYRPWYAMAEFVDNAIQSYLDHKAELRSLHGKGFVLEIEIDVESGGERVSVRDNAAGIHTKDYARAFRPSEPPPDTKGLSEFGVGMKSAACWFAANWSVRTSALGEPVERTIKIDVAKVVETQLETIYPTKKPAKANDHYTELILDNLHAPLIHGRTIKKIKDHLASMYRAFLREAEVRILYNGEQLQYIEPDVLEAPFYKDENGRPVLWRKDIDITFGPKGRCWASGFAAIRKKGSSQEAGFALLRRKRIIAGSGDEGYRPDEIFGRSTTNFRYQRLFGELEIHGVEVSHTKDAFNWGSLEEEFLEKLKEQLQAKPLDLLDQADEYRSKAAKGDLKPAAKHALTAALGAVAKAGPDIEVGLAKMPEPDLRPGAPAPAPKEIPEVLEANSQMLRVADTDWHVAVELTTKPELGDWLSIQENPPKKGQKNARNLVIRISMAHPFMVRFGVQDKDHLEPLVRLGIAIAIAEKIAVGGGVKNAGTIRREINSMLRGALSRP